MKVINVLHNVVTVQYPQAWNPRSPLLTVIFSRLAEGMKVGLVVERKPAQPAAHRVVPPVSKTSSSVEHSKASAPGHAPAATVHHATRSTGVVASHSQVLAAASAVAAKGHVATALTSPGGGSAKASPSKGPVAHSAQVKTTPTKATTSSHVAAKDGLAKTK